MLGALFLLLGAGLSADENAPIDPKDAENAEKWEIKVADTRSFVGIAPVYLSVGVLRVEDEAYLTGRFSVRVPLRRSKNDDGLIQIPMDMPWETLRKEGGKLRGLAISDDPEPEPNRIECTVHPEDGTITLAITTPDRTILFESTYELRKRSDDPN